MDNYFEIGIITGTHGINGTIKIYPTTDDINRFNLLDNIKIKMPDPKRPGDANDTEVFEIEKIWFHKQFIMLKLKGIDTPNEALRLKSGILIISPDKAISLGEDEYFLRDLTGLSVYTTDGEFLGILSQVLPTGANDVYIVKKQNAKDLLIPAIKQCIKKVDLENKEMTVMLLEGLRDL